MSNTLIGKLRIVIVCIFLLHSISYACAYQYNMHHLQTKEVLDTIITNYNNIKNTSNIVWSSLVAINIDSLFQADSIQISLDNESIVLRELFAEHSAKSHYRHLSSINSNADMYLTYIDDVIFGSINAASGQYTIIPLSDKVVIVAKYTEEDREEEPELKIVQQENSESHEDFYQNDHLERDGEVSVIRVLFLYTSAAYNMMLPFSPASRMKSIAYTYINQANESFINSNIDARLQLAYVGPTNFNESGKTWDDILSYFAGTDDGYIDDVHALRNKYAADVCVLFINRSEYCGLGYVNASADNAFCLTCPSFGCNDKYTAVHEIGHLLGCRHNMEEDGHLAPYPYGHGFYHYVANNSNDSWRTMMSYDNNCSTGCTRILYWSNPDIYYKGNATGTTTLQNNAQVWNVRASTVSSFKSKPFTSLLTANSNSSLLYASVEAFISVTIKDGYEVHSGQTVDVAALGAVRLCPNTHISAGANFRASIRPNADSNMYPQFAPSNHEVSDVFVENNTQSGQNDSANQRPRKILRNGQILILQGKRAYTITGQELEK